MNKNLYKLGLVSTLVGITDYGDIHRMIFLVAANWRRQRIDIVEDVRFESALVLTYRYLNVSPDTE
jgi:hypothetical protein